MDKIHPRLTPRILTAIFVLYAFLISFIFFNDQLIHAAAKPFWGDETYGLTHSIRAFSYSQILKDGVQGQSSPSPLDYIFGKILDDIRPLVHSFGLRDEVYYRLWANAVTTLGALIVMLAFIRDIARRENPGPIKSLQIFLLSIMPIALWYMFFIYYYAAETRPYATWYSLYFVTLAAGLLRHTQGQKNNTPFMICLILLAMTATAAMFQIFTLIAAFFIMHRLENVPLRSSLKELFKVFVIPIAITLYYACRPLTCGDTNAAVDRKLFFELWTHKSIMILYLVAAVVLCLLKKDNQKYIIAPLSFLLLYLMGPLIFGVTKLRSYFFAERQYGYYDIFYAIFLLTVIQCLPAYLRDIRNKKWLTGAVIVIAFLVGLMVLRPKIIRNFKNAVYNAYTLVFLQSSRQQLQANEL